MRRSSLFWISLLLPASRAFAQFPKDADMGGPETRSSLLLVIYLSIVLFWLVVALFIYVGGLKTYHRIRRAYRESRKEHFRKGLEALLMEEPFETVAEAFRPLRPLDQDIIQDVLVDAMRHIQGDPFETLMKVSRKHGFIEHGLRGLRSGSRHVRGRSMEALGAMRAQQAIDPILALLRSEALDLKIVALRSLAAIGDPRTLPHFVEASDYLPPPILPRLASLMLEFGPAGHDYVHQVINRHSEVFPKLMLEELLKILATDLKRPA